MLNNLKRLHRITSYPHFWPLVLVVFFSWLASRHLFGYGYFNMHDDLQMMRQLSMEKCFMDLQIPCRWIPDMGYGFGYPLFNFYPPLPYLVGQLFRLIGYSFVDTAKALFITAFFASGATMYVFAQRFFGRLGGVLSAVFYIWAPYHAVDIYVRGAMNESWGLIWFPLILFFSYNAIARKEKSFIPSRRQFFDLLLLAMSWAALLTSHNLMVIVFTPVFALWCIVWLVYYKNVKAVPQLMLTGSWAFAQAAFFTLPVFLEKGIVQTATLVKGYYEYTAHFPSAAQLFISRYWGYGPSVWMTQDDKMSFQIGWFHWILPLIVVLVLGVRFLKNKKISPLQIAVGIMFSIGALAVFMSHPRSTPIWAQIEALQFIQFPWRYLTMVILGFSFVAGAILSQFSRVCRYILFVLLSFCVVVYGWVYFQPENGKLGLLTDAQKFTGAAWELQQTAGIYDYLPQTARTAPKGPRVVQAEIMEGTGKIIEGTSGTNWEQFKVEGETETTVRVSVLAFPYWDVTVDGDPVETFVPDTEEWGRLYFRAPTGVHEIDIQLKDTPIRIIGNYISLLTWLGTAVFAYLVWKHKVLR